MSTRGPADLVEGLRQIRLARHGPERSGANAERGHERLFLKPVLRDGERPRARMQRGLPCDHLGGPARHILELVSDDAAALREGASAASSS